MLSGIDAELRKAGKFTIFATGHSDEEKEKEAIRFLLSRNCDALILHVEALADEFLVAQKDNNIPFVVVNRTVAGLEKNCISLNNEHGGYAATHFLLEMGHRKIAYVSGPLGWGDAQDRFAGHRRALQDFDVEFDERLMVEGDYHESGGSKALKKLFTRGGQFSAVVCANDEMAAGAMDAARANGMSMPEDLSIIGFDNAPLARYLYPKLSTVNYPISDMGRMAAHWVLKKVYDSDDYVIQHMFLPKLVKRDSVSVYAGQ
jgi:LacI family transcriptional regulator